MNDKTTLPHEKLPYHQVVEGPLTTTSRLLRKVEPLKRTRHPRTIESEDRSKAPHGLQE